MSDRCRECGSERIGPFFALGLVPTDHGAAPQVRARACADCGSMQLFAENALDLYLAHQRALDDAVPKTAPALNIQCPSCGSMLPAASLTCEVCGWTEGRA
jgi:hypothetical protein